MPIIGNIKTRGELQDDLFCLQEERDYFQSKFLEQVSEIKAMKDELAKSKKEIRRLRMFLMDQENHPTENIILDQIETPKAGRPTVVDPADDEEDEELHIAKKDDASSLTQDEIEELDKQDKRLEAEAAAAESTTPPRTTSSRYDDKPEEEEEDVRKSAEKLLAWASYRSTMSTSRGSRSNNGDHDHSSVMSPSVRTAGSARQSLLGKMIETMEDEDDEEIDQRLLNGGSHIEEKKEEDSALDKASLSLDANDE
mmetsp:Transcript_6177/g.15283  ORF Transcript_6177/g.15283 Transcript_6177/m.15283 type:complete len:254 (+) Transcript_6177:429-1190(+)|eukprot:CAMPEP_0197186580 /NCGR_PEP_ID=MMETSP1423-20130617/14215_1 /TAXON_ID=476441 /ORGANISM="Pseudo-nitzschia heimii, Strain UNC1101" /LENGTH=253 /DNA_ID=CAMNT_0042637935 /DNA_START=335 /DNA_END=1096 /DNA_ORIENTATION=-